MRPHGQGRHKGSIVKRMAEGPLQKLAHVRPVRPLDFPSSEPCEEHLGQSQRHLELCFLLFALLKRLVAPEHSCGSDQFVYWNARTNRRQLAPDGFVKLGVPHETFDSWKTWEKGIPELAVEILSPSDTPERWAFEEKLERYHELGVRELVCFNVDAEPGERLRVWDLMEGDLVERVVGAERTPCLTLGALDGAAYEWLVAPAEACPAALRLAREGELVLFDSEELAEERQRRVEEQRRTEAALARVRELEAELSRRGG